MNVTFLSVLPVLSYIGAGYLVFRRLANSGAQNEAGSSPVLILVLMAIALHGVILYQNFAATVGMNFGVFNALSLLTWLVALLLLLAMFSRPVENLGMVVFPMAAMALVLETAFTTEHIVSGDNFSLNVHILISILSYSIFTIAAI